VSCDNLCTAAKCAELERRINDLEAQLNAHKALDIPQAHDYKSNLKIDGSFQSETLTITVADVTSQDTATILIPDNQGEVTVSLATNSDANTLKVYVKVGDKSDDETVTLPSPSVEVDLNVVDDALYLDVTVGNQHGQDTVTLPSPPVEVDLNAVDDALYLDVTVGNQHAQDTVTLPSPPVEVSLAVAGNDLKVFVKVGNKSDSAIIELPKVDPLDWLDLLKNLLAAALLADLKEDLKDLIRDAIAKLIEELFDSLFRNLSITSDFNPGNRQLQICVSNGRNSDCTNVYIPRGGGGGSDDTNDFLSGSGYLDEAGILNLLINSSIGNADIQVDMGLAEIERLLTEVHEYTVVDIEGNTATKFLCVDPNLKTPKPEDNQTQLAYTGKGFAGLHELTKTFNDNLLTVFNEICQKEVVAAVPEWWQVRAGSDRPQLVVIYRAGTSNWSMSIPWYRGAYKSAIIKQIPGYTRGAYASYLTLGDNSKIVVNAVSKQAGEVFLSRIRSVISSEMLKDATIQTGGERKGKPINNVAVKPVYAKYFANGQKDQLPDWGYNFLTDKWVKYVKATE
jgi:hypothetical protein